MWKRLRNLVISLDPAKIWRALRHFFVKRALHHASFLMTNFFESISVQPINKKAMVKDPFSVLVPCQGEGKIIKGFDCDSTKIQSLKPLKLDYIKLQDIGPRSKARPFYTIGVVCESSHGTLTISDLHRCQFALFTEGCGNFVRGDIIGLANPEVSGFLRIRSKKQVVLIGHSNSVQECQAEDKNHPNCSGYVNKHQGLLCDYHCEEEFRRAGVHRQLLHGNSSPSVSPFSSPKRENYNILEGNDLPEISPKFVDEYLKKHSTGRGARINKKLNNDDEIKPKIGQGYTFGQTIRL